jgi:hypothetical protein
MIEEIQINVDGDALIDRSPVLWIAGYDGVIFRSVILLTVRVLFSICHVFVLFINKHEY